MRESSRAKGWRGRSRGLVTAISSYAGAHHGRWKKGGPNTGRGGIFYPGRKKRGPANILSCHSPRLQGPTILCEAGWRRLDWREFRRDGSGLKQCSPATSSGGFKPSHPTSSSTGRGPERDTWRAGVRPACVHALSRPLATPQNSVCSPVRRGPSRTGGLSPLLRLSQKS